MFFICLLCGFNFIHTKTSCFDCECCTSPRTLRVHECVFFWLSVVPWRRPELICVQRETPVPSPPSGCNSPLKSSTDLLQRDSDLLQPLTAARVHTASEPRVSNTFNPLQGGCFGRNILKDVFQEMYRSDVTKPLTLSIIVEKSVLFSKAAFIWLKYS